MKGPTYTETEHTFQDNTEEWDKYERELEHGTCDHCGRRDVPVVFIRDPFLAEVHPEDPNEDTWWCMPCYDCRHDEV